MRGEIGERRDRCEGRSVRSLFALPELCSAAVIMDPRLRGDDCRRGLELSIWVKLG